MRLVRVGEGAAALLAGRGTGRVVAVFRRAVYLSVPGGLFALVDTEVEPGPLHAHVTALPSVVVGEQVRVDGGDLWVAQVRVPGSPVVWRPRPLADPAAVTAALRRVLDHDPVLDLDDGPGPAGEVTLSATLRRRGLAAAVDVLAGRGSGLTPAGDDVVAGLLLVARAAAGSAHEARLVALARQAPTHDISRAFLEWAARGRSLAALHDLVAACGDGDLGGAHQARARLARAGHTSGLDLAYGVLVGSANCATAPWLGGSAPSVPVESPV
ncbi:DUF2877 domain-containing protein [Planosporangium flavigriseum]|uniref:DUF2877 domain-containing protein n=1 Tax=Planosporangium flavigriseum TaxID=373681 RepID=A0A8J3PMM7_9ACTN|nr:DUF2877 domain-containing protein [Planosporangium flavigriseum]NJC63037.1 DUF2877 domain-containing protein [Planosporangium flavigriseum]GIG73091.1 hypothetical protein Pfl04_14950 [Planosporangium flavigriseum]